MTWKNLGYQPHPWRAATRCMSAAVKAGEVKTSTRRLGSTASPFPTTVYAGRLRLVLECEEHGGSRCWLVGWSTFCPGPIALYTGYPASRLPSYLASRPGVQNPSREASALEG